MILRACESVTVNCWISVCDTVCACFASSCHPKCVVCEGEIASKKSNIMFGQEDSEGGEEGVGVVVGAG